MHILTIAGNVGKDAVLRNTQGGDAVLGFSVAVDTGKDRDGNKRPAQWYDCSIWGKRATALEHHITKGTKLSLSGRPTARAHDGKAYIGLVVDQLTFLGGGDNSGGNRDGGGYGGQQGGGYGGTAHSGQRGPTGGPRDLDDDVPFQHWGARG